MPWYAVGEQHKPALVWFWFVEMPFASPQEAYAAAQHEAKHGDDWREPIITMFQAESVAAARNETIRRGLDWRLTGQYRWLKGTTLTWQKYDKSFENHCVFCWRKFLNRNTPGIEPEWFEDDYIEDAGYAVLAHGKFADGYHWVCRYCFSDFASAFEWNVVNESEMH